MKWTKSARGAWLCLLPLLLGAGAQPSTQPVAPAREPVEIAVLSYNTHGLPAWIAGDDPEQRFPLISTRLRTYQVALIQEDWSWHELLVRDAPHPVDEPGNGPESALRSALGVFNGSGLTTLVNLGRDRLVDVTREPLGACAGWVSGGNDCWASKGFLRLRLRLDNGAELDFYNLHLDAGRDASDREARRAQLVRLRERVAALSGDGALVVGGDFNCDADDPEDASLLAEFGAALRLSDSGALASSGGKRIDYIFYRAGAQTSVQPIRAHEASEFSVEGVPLSDHPALTASFRVR